VDSGGYWADVLASAMAPGEGRLPIAYREITCLVSLHAEAGHVFVNCAARLGLQPDDDEDNGGGGGSGGWTSGRRPSATPTTRFWR